MARPLLAALAALLLIPASATAAEGFPKGFLWGVATAGFQGDMGKGAPNDQASDWWTWVRDPDNIAKDHVSGDLPENGPAQWTHYRQDVALARNKLHANAFRVSIEWSRIFPRSTEGAATTGELDAVADQAALAHYRAQLTAIRKAHMKPFVTLVHFTLPSWLHDPIAARSAFASVGPDDPPPSGFPAGWLDSRAPREFGKYAGYVASKLGGLVDWWMPINEPNVASVQGYLNVENVFASWFPPGAFNYSAVIRTLFAQARGNAAAYDAIKAADPTSRVGLVEHAIAWRPANKSSVDDARGAAHADYLFNLAVPNAVVKGDYDENANGAIEPGEHHDELARKADFAGINYYRPGVVTGLSTPLSKNIPLYDFIPKVEFTRKDCPGTCTDVGWQVLPSGLTRILREFKGYGLPMYITENGIADSRDRLRSRYIRDHVAVVRAAIRRGIDVRGYFYWTLEDNLEWSDGYAPKFGLFTKSRRMRPSAKVFAALTR